MTFQQLQYILEVSRTDSISGAAKKLFLAQSSVSAAISHLEEELGFPIFIRTKKGVIPTVQGSSVIEQVARICESYRAMTEVGGNAQKHIRISAPGIELLNEAFADLVAHYAGDESVSFSVDMFSTTEIVAKLSAFELDVAVMLNHKGRFLSVETLLNSKGLSWQSIATLPVVIQIGPAHPLYQKEHIEIEELRDYLLVDSIEDPLVHNEYLKGIIQLRPEKTVSVKSSHTKNLLIAKGLAYSIGVDAPKAVAESLQFRNIPLKDVSYNLTVVTNPLRQSDPEVETYIRLIKKCFGKG